MNPNNIAEIGAEIGGGLRLALAEGGDALQAVFFAHVALENMQAALFELSQLAPHAADIGSRQLGMAACLAQLAEVARASLSVALATQNKARAAAQAKAPKVAGRGGAP